MKRIGILSLACILVLFFSTSALAWGWKWKPPKYSPPTCPTCDPCIYKSSKNQLPAGQWSETYVGGGPGLPNNVLFAKGGSDWTFDGARLVDVEEITGTVELGNIGSGIPQRCFVTRYVGGTFTFNKFSYCCGKPLVAYNVTAFVYTCKGPSDDEVVVDQVDGWPFGHFFTFTVKFSGHFGEADAVGVDSTNLTDGVAFEAIGHYAGVPKINLSATPAKTSDCLDSVELIIKGDIRGFCEVDGNNDNPE